jgi:hypothetical protein
LKTTLATSAAALAAAVLFSSAPLRAQQAPASPSPDTPSEAAPAPPASPAPAPTPMAVLRGPNHETMRALAAALQTETQHAVQGTLAATTRPTRRFMPGVRILARRAEWLRKSIDEYQATPFDVAGTVSMMHGRATMLGRRMRNNPGLAHVWEDWDLVIDLLDRMQKLLAGETVTVPPPHTPRPAPSPAATASPTPDPSPAVREWHP